MMSATKGTMIATARKSSPVDLGLQWHFDLVGLKVCVSAAAARSRTGRPPKHTPVRPRCRDQHLFDLKNDWLVRSITPRHALAPSCRIPQLLQNG
jgi:hypothetical protein